MQFVMNLADALVVLDFGMKIAEGTPVRSVDIQRLSPSIWRRGGARETQRRMSDTTLLELSHVSAAYGHVRVSRT